MERSDLHGLSCGKEKAELLHVVCVQSPQFAVVSIPMSETVLELAQAIRALPRRDVEELREWIEDYFQLEFTDDFAAGIERGKKEITEGNVRIRNPEQA